MKSTITTLLTLLALLLDFSHVLSFAPSPILVNKPCTVTTTTELGLFDFMQPKKQPKKDTEGQKDMDMFSGRGKRITIREDEDDAMWIEEDPKSGKRKSAWPFGK